MTAPSIFLAPQGVYLHPEHGGVITGPVSVEVRAGVITRVWDRVLAASALPAGVKPIRLEPGHALIPGLVDTHVHINEPGRGEWEGFASATAAALAGGVTTLIDMPLNSIPSTVDRPALALKREVAAPLVRNAVGFWGGAVPGNLGTGELRALWEAGVFGFKCFLLDSGVEEFPPLSARELVQAMTEIAEFDGLLIVHAEDAQTIAAAERAQHGAGGITTEYGTFGASRPPLAEQRAIETVISAAEATGCRTHILHLSDGDSLPVLRAAKARGVRITVETCPHYLALFAEEVPDGATQFKCCPPIRSARNRELLWAGLRDGTIDMIVSDHSPCTAELKRFADPAAQTGGSFGAAWGGIASVQLGLAVTWSQARLRGFGLADVVRWMAHTPARWSGLGDRGALEVGRRADLVSVAVDDAFVVDPLRLHHKNPVTAYSGRAYAGVVRQVWRDGRLVFARGAADGTDSFPGGGGALLDGPGTTR